MIGLVGFAVASAIGGAAVDFPMLVAARAVQGAFGALLAPAGLSLLTTTFTEAKERGKAFGIYGGIAGAGASIGLLLGGFLTEYASWRWTMFVNLIFAAFALVGGAVFLTHRAAEIRPHLDLTGTVLVSAGLFSLVYGFSNADTNGWSNPVTVGFLVAAAVLLVAFVAFESRAANPLLPMRVVLDRNRGGAYLAMFFAAIGMFGVFLFLTYYLEVSLGYSSVKTGLVFLPMTALLVITAGTASTLLATRVSPRAAHSGRDDHRRHRHVDADADRPAIALPVGDPARHAGHRPRPRADLRAGVQHRHPRRQARGLGSRVGRRSTPSSRSAARSARRC